MRVEPAGGEQTSRGIFSSRLAVSPSGSLVVRVPVQCMGWLGFSSGAGRDPALQVPVTEHRALVTRRNALVCVDILDGWSAVLPRDDPGPSVLLVEDDPAGRLLYAAWLTEAGFTVRQAHNGLQALERAFDEVPSVVVTDLDIPGIDGFELTRRLKRDPRTRAVPVVAITGYSVFASDPERAHRAGCDVVLSKPCAPEEIERTVRRLLNGSSHSPGTRADD